MAIQMAPHATISIPRSRARHAAPGSHEASHNNYDHDYDVRPRVEPAAGPRAFAERRSSEAMLNGNALRLGIAAQMLASTTQSLPTNLMPLPPVARTAARYESTSQGLGRSHSMGFSRTV